MILPSNSMARSFPENTSSNYTIPLHQALKTPDDEHWKIGLISIQLPITFYNIESSESLYFTKQDASINEIHPKEGIFTTPESITEMLSTVCQTQATFSWFPETGFNVKLDPSIKELRFTKKLKNILGFDTRIKRAGENVIYSNFINFDPWINHRVLFIECSLVETLQINDEHRRIIQTVVINDFNFGKTFSHTYYPIDFMKVQGELHSDIKIKIVDSYKQPIRFHSGVTVLEIILKNKTDVGI